MSYNTNAQQIKHLGSILRIEQAEGVKVFTQQGSLSLHPYSDNIVRMTISFLEEEAYFSYAVIQQEKKSITWQMKENKHSILLKGKTIHISINKETSAVQFLNAEGKIVLEHEPSLTTAILGTEISVFNKLHADEKFIGLGEKTGTLNRRGKFYIHKNSDTFAFGVSQDPTYSSIPFFIGLHDGLMYGVFLDSTYQSAFDFGVSNDRYFSFAIENGNLHYYFIYGETIEEIITHYTWLTGRMTMPPLWSIGFHQSRYSYYPEYKLDEVVRGFENRNIPCDAIHLDIHYMDTYKAFTFDKQKFPNPKKTIAKLIKKGIHAVPILDPGIKKEKKYFPYEDGIKKNTFVPYVDGQLFEGGVWPGICHFPDFTNPQVRKWWASLCTYYTDLGIDAFWNDMNEPAVWGQVFPTHTLFDYDGHGATFKKVGNVYGLLMSRASYEGLRAKNKNKRYFLLTRAAYAGIQRYAAKWTGDNVAQDEHILLAARQVNSLGLSGVAFSGSDVGGFVGNSDGMLYARWMALGCFTPFFRAHKMINSNSSEPWCFGEETEQIATNYIRLRYRLIPYLYHHFYIATQNGTPINKPMCMLEPYQAWVYDSKFENQFLHGDALLVCPLESHTKDISIYLPEGHWFDFYTDKIIKGRREMRISTNKETIPVFVKEGKIICMQKPLPNLNGGMDKIIEVHIYPKKNSHTQELTTGILYEDDGISLNYQKQQIAITQFIYDDQKQILRIKKSKTSFKSTVKYFKVYLHDKKLSSLRVDMNGKLKSIKLTLSSYVILDPIPNFDPFVDQEQGRKEVPVYGGMV